MSGRMRIARGLAASWRWLAGTVIVLLLLLLAVLMLTGGATTAPFIYALY